MVQDNNKDDTAYLRLMLDSFAKISRFIKDLTFENFSDDEKTQSAVIMQLQVIGELAKKVPDNFKESIGVPWKNMVGLRDLVSHDYFGLDIDVIWHTAKESVPETEKNIKEYLSKNK
ncbi:MAG TPA: DUF86 domain-containing protein [Candidatus Paceibacterota bacterium]